MLTSKKLHVTLLSKKKGIKKYSWYDSIYVTFLSILVDGRISIFQYSFYLKFFFPHKHVFTLKIGRKNQAIFIRGGKKNITSVRPK